MRTDWMPAKQDDILTMAKTWIDVLTANNNWEDWDFQESEFLELNRLYTDAHARFDDDNSIRGGSVTAEALRTAMSALTVFMRKIRARRFIVPPLTNANLISLRLQLYDDIPTERVVVTELVDFVLRPGAEGQVIVDFRQQSVEHKEKPAGYDGAVIIWGILDAEPVRNEHLHNYTMASRTPHTLSFSREERGKKVWVSIAWQNELGMTGEWAACKSAIVP